MFYLYFCMYLIVHVGAKHSANANINKPVELYLKEFY